MRIFANALSMLLGVALTLAAVGVLLYATRLIEPMTHPVGRALAIAATIGLGVVVLVGSVFIATHVAVLLAAKDAPPKTAPVDLRPRGSRENPHT